MIKVEIANEQTEHAVDAELLQRAVRKVLDGEAVDQGDVSVAIVDDPTIHSLNRQYLQHDYPTDVLSFLLSGADEPLDGEVIVSAETAAREAVRYGWEPGDELLLYLIHGTLHLLGYEDGSQAERKQMQAKERQYLAAFGRPPRDEPQLSAGFDAPITPHCGEGDTQS